MYNRLDLGGRVLHEVEMMQGQRCAGGQSSYNKDDMNDSQDIPNQHAESP